MLQRFISQDPIGFNGGMNLYGYAGNNPVSLLDPFGTNPQQGTVPPWLPLLMAIPELGPELGIAAEAAEEMVATAEVTEGVAAEGASLPASETWGNPGTLAEHFEEHGADFGATSSENYANEASQFLKDSQANGLPTKIDANGTIRVYDPETNTFGSYNADGTTKTFFKPTSPTYWDRQPGIAPMIIGGK